MRVKYHKSGQNPVFGAVLGCRAACGGFVPFPISLREGSGSRSPCSNSTAVSQWIHAHAPVYISSGSQLFGVCPQEFRKIWLSEEMRCTSSALQWSHALASVYGGGHFTRPFSAVSPEKYRNLNTLGDDFRSCFRILGSTADTRAHAFVHGFW